MENKKTVNNIPYMEILRKSFRLAWKNKLLWWFGFLIALSSPGSLNLNFPSGGNSDISDQKIETYMQPAKDFFFQYLNWIILGIAILVLIGLVLYAIGKIARGALIKSINEINNGKQIGFKTGMIEGTKYFWKILGLDILLGLSLSIISLIVLAPSIILFVYQAYVSGVFLILLAISFIVALAILASFLRNYGRIYIVLAGLPIWTSIENAYALFKKNFWPSIVLALLLMAIGLGTGIAFLLALFVLIMLLIALGLLAWVLAKTVGIIIFGIIATLILLVVIFIVRSALEVFYQTVWILFFKEIAVQIKTVEAVAEPVLETKIEAKPSESVNMTKS